MRWIALATVFWGSMMGVGFVVADSRARIGLQRGVLEHKTTQRLEPPNWRTTFLKKKDSP